MASKSPALAGGAAATFSWMDEERREALQPETLAFARLLIAGTVEKIETIDGGHQGAAGALGLLPPVQGRPGHPADERLLLLFQKDIPATVTIDEAVDIAKEFGTDDSYRFINGVLDGIRKQRNP